MSGAVRRGVTVERVMVLLFALAVLAVHDVGYMLRHPFWTDEEWVAVTTRFPLTQLPRVTSATPIGWSVLLRLVPFGGKQDLRLVPLAFSGATVAAAYWFARRLGWADERTAVGAGVLAALGALLVPAMLVRSDLKQYTADAFLALVVLAVTSRVDRGLGRRELATLGCVIAGGMLFSHTTAFVGIAAFTSVAVIQLSRRAWPALLESVVAGAATAICMVGVYFAFDARAVGPGLTQFWAGYFVPVRLGIGASVHFLKVHVELQVASLGLGPLWVIVVLVIAGLVTIVRLGRPSTALTVVVLWAEMVLLSALRKYPFLDERTSTFLFVVTIAIAAVGVAGICALVQRWTTPVGALVLGLALAVTFVVQVRPAIREHAIPSEDLAHPVAYVAAHRTAADVILVNAISNFGFAYYWPYGHPSAIDSTKVLQGYLAVFPAQPRIVIARASSLFAVSKALDSALALAGTRPGVRIWVVRSRVTAKEARAWREALAALGLHLTPVGPRGLTVIAPG